MNTAFDEDVSAKAVSIQPAMRPLEIIPREFDMTDADKWLASLSCLPVKCHFRKRFISDIIRTTILKAI